MRKVLFTFFLLASIRVQAQNVGIGTGNPHPKAVLHLEDSTRAFLPPRMTTLQRDSLTNLTPGLVIYNVTTNCLEFWNSVKWVSTCATTLPCVDPPTPVPTPNDTFYFCMGSNGQLCVNNIAGLTYIWTGPNNFYATGACVTVPNVSMASFGTYTVYAYNATTGCASRDTVVVALQKTTPYFTCTTPNTWNALPAPPNTIPTRGDHVVTALNNKIYFGMGENGPCLGDWWEYDICSATWTQKANAPITIGGAAFIFTLGGYIYVGGGGWGCGTFRNQVYRYDPSNNTWTAVANLATLGRRGAYGTSDGTYGYVVGGELSSGTISDTVWRYDPVANTWSYLTRYPVSGIAWGVMAYASGKLFVGSGGPALSFCSANFYAYDLGANSWTAMTPHPIGNNDGWVTLDPTKNRIYFTTGWYGGGCGSAPNQHYYYDVATNTWNAITNFPSARNNINMVFYDGILYAGFGEGPYVRDWWAFCPPN